MNQKKIERLSGLDRSPEEILNDYDHRQRSWIGRLLRYRKVGIAKYLVSDDVPQEYMNHSIRLSLSQEVRRKLIGVAMHVAALCASFFFGLKVGNEPVIEGNLIYLGCMMIAAVLGAACMTIDAAMGKKAWRPFKWWMMAIFVPPAYIVLRGVDWWILKNPSHPMLRDLEKTLANSTERARFVEASYRHGLKETQERILGKKSNIMHQRSLLEAALEQIRKDKAEVELELASGEKKRMTQAFNSALALLQQQEVRYQSRLNRLDTQVIPYLQVVFQRLEARINRIDSDVSAQELIQRIHTRAERSSAELEAFDQALIQEVQIAVRHLLRVQSVLAGSLPSATSVGTEQEQQLDAWFSQMDQVAQETGELEHLMEQPPPLLAEGKSIH